MPQTVLEQLRTSLTQEWGMNVTRGHLPQGYESVPGAVQYVDGVPTGTILLKVRRSEVQTPGLEQTFLDCDCYGVSFAAAWAAADALTAELRRLGGRVLTLGEIENKRGPNR